ncbi:hypothetical protein FHU41_002754 [Psychromicrobium silvestre]|uniref:Uncharacterized protein n=1 Tax=Psychromicrobium silvestre TaxID=1645614 RepID=A0A7Y9LVR7_9MICC|nr:hypothetical protein [Psychromicrobium silvestre]NYE96504.1 hypothetical protein [Psychromicrobium silvestre]
MVRPGDWELLGGSDPCPGSIDDVQAAARTWQDNYNILNEVRSGLASSGITGNGQAVTAVRTLLNRNAALAGAIADRAQSNADVFFTWGGQLTQFQADADRLLTQAIQADEDRQQALALMAASGGGIPTPTLQSPFTQNTQNAPASPFPASTDAGLAGLLEDQAREADRQRGQALLNQAQQHLDDLSRQADELHQAHQDAGNTCAKNLQPLDLAAVTHDSGIDPSLPGRRRRPHRVAESG